MLKVTRKNQKRLKTNDALADTSWPMIHCDPQGTKTSPYAGPSMKDAPTILAQLDSNVILMLSTPKVIYVQEAMNYVKAFDAETLDLLYTSPNLGATFPFFAGGSLDANGYLWFTANNRIARLSPDLSEVVWSEYFQPEDKAFNTCCFLPDGNLLATSSTAAHVIDPEINNGTFSVISTLNLSALTWNGQQVYTDIPIMPRPVRDDQNGLYFTSAGFVSKLEYDVSTQKILPNVIWAVPHNERADFFSLSDAVVVSSNVYAAAKPTDNYAMEVYRIDSTAGFVLGICTPFPEAIGYSSAHCVGAVSDKNILIVICETPDLTGGMAAVDATSMEVLWHAPLANIGGAFCCSASSNKAYIINRDPNDSMLKYWAIDLDNGETTILHQYPSDTDPAISLSSVGYEGRLYYPNPTPGFAMIQDSNIINSIKNH